MSAEMIQPIQPGSLHQAYTICSIKEDNYRTRTFIFDRALPSNPGQFVMVWLPGNTEKPFSIAGNDPLQLTIVAVGLFTDVVHTLKVGDRMWVRGPLGQGYRPYGKRILMAGGGYGAAPLLFLARQAIASGMEVHACTGARTERDVLLAEDFKVLGAHVYVTTDDGSLGEKGIITQPIERLLQDPAARPDGGVYACGPVRMLEAIDALCSRYSVPRQLSWEAHMRCGIGLCGSCEIALPVSQGDPDRAAWLVCLEGPVSFSG
jgi:dihydroorotate dehydrogenase electron transfer subunit